MATPRTPRDPKSPRPRVVIVGGGFGGMETAKSLDGAPCDVVVIDQANYHLFQPLLYQVAMAGLSPAEIASPIRGILGDQENARVMLGQVTGVDLEAREVKLGDDVVPYDTLVLAVGARSTYFGHDEWERYAPSLKTLEDALEIRRRVLLAFEHAELATDPIERTRHLSFVVIGGGPTGCELAGSISELARYVVSRDFRSIDPRETRVVLVEAGERILPSFPADLSQSAVEQLGEIGVEVKTGSMVVAIDENGVEIEGATPAAEGPGPGRERERIVSSTVVWGAGVRANDLGRTLGVPVDRSGRVEILPDCSIPGHPEVFAIGDMARLDQDGSPLPGVSPVAMQQARHVGKILRAEMAGSTKPREPFHYVDKGSMATIGRSRAIAWARGIKMQGFLAWMAWLVVHLWYLISFRNRVFVLLNWGWSYIAYARGARLITTTGWRKAGTDPAPSKPAADAPKAIPQVAAGAWTAPAAASTPAAAPDEREAAPV
jgi:NADH dehydrogenase